ncbi:MAG: ABC-2 family transporter protein [Methanomassiliicoccales archaeon PtaB.Bin215]|nr:MAG: ABC-2 family transporter protein [Methanomassiliicoccales archaeon PtaB.Bin215]
MGLDPIGYKPWDGARTEHGRRFLVVAESILRHKLKAKWFLALLIIGTFLVHVMPLFIYSLIPHRELEASVMRDYMGDGLYFIFEVILVALVCSDLISEDMRSNSFILYVSRAMGVKGYLLGKWTGAMVAVGLFTLLPPLAVAIAITATQSGSDYLGSLAVIGQTLIAGVWSAALLVPAGLAVSSLTKKKTYASVGTFMFFFGMMLVSGIFSGLSPDWSLLNPSEVLYQSHTVLYGLELNDSVNRALLAAMGFLLTVPPMTLVYYRIMRKEAGK